jgi:TRAP-type mannitol/chloroaromatic compound transport system substrate-binding protein
MIRRPLLLASALLAAFGLSGCKEEPAAQQSAAAPAAESFHWKMVTAWPKNYPGLGTAAERLAERVKTMSNGRLTIKVYAGGELVPPLEVFDAVSRGTAELGHGAAYYWKGKVPAAQFFTAVPFGLSTSEMNAWLSKGGGQALWDEAYAPYGVKPVVVGNTGMQMGGWFNKEINSLDDLKGLKIRTPGLGGEVFSRLGSITVNLPGGEVCTALQTSAIDATDWVYYYPGWQEPQAVLELLINQKALDSLPADLQAILTEAARAASQDMLDDYVYHNALALDELKQQGTLLKRFPDDVLAAMQRESEVVLGELAAQSELNGRIWASMQAFQAQVSKMHEISEKELYNWR